jgi:hypothetical protein
MAEDSALARIGLSIVASIPALLIVFGICLGVLGLAGGVTYNRILPITGERERWVAAGVGLALVIVGLWRSISGVTDQIPDPQSFGVEITYPPRGAGVSKLTVTGRMENINLPPGYSLRVFRHYPGKPDFVPMSEAVINAKTKTWEAGGCDIGGALGDAREIGVHLVGPAGKVLLEYYKLAAEKHREAGKQLERLGGTPSWAPPIHGRTPDIVECARVSVTRS